jgi:hypothetical protein
MVEIFGKYYYLDLDSVTESCRTGEIVDEYGNSSTEINVFKYDLVKMCIDRVLNEYDETDENIGVFAQKETSLSFKMAFNTLIKGGILKEDDE